MKIIPGKLPIRYATVGYGGAFNMGRHHFDLAATAGIKPAAVVEIDAKRRLAAERDFPGIKTFASVAELVAADAADLVLVLTPHNLHYSLGMELLEAGRHVILEKPMALTADECDALIAQAKASEVLLTAYHNRHWDGPILHLVNRLLKEAAIGSIYKVQIRIGGREAPFATWRGSKSISGGLAYDWGVHCLEYALQLMGDDITEVSGFAKQGYWQKRTQWGDDSVEDEVFFTARFRDGRWLSLTQSLIDGQLGEGLVEITGEEGTCFFGDSSYRLIRHGENGRTIEERVKLPNRYHLFYENVSKVLRGEERLVISPEWARTMIRLLHTAERSAHEGRSLPMPGL
jgi:scyllo-inositol 2-dehydrogenase (NADP+)